MFRLPPSLTLTHHSTSLCPPLFSSKHFSRLDFDYLCTCLWFISPWRV